MYVFFLCVPVRANLLDLVSQFYFEYQNCAPCAWLFPFLCLAYMGRTIDSLSGFTLFGISCIRVFVFEKKKKLNELLFEK